VWKGRALKAWIPGGSSCGLLPASLIDTRMDHDSLRAAGTMFGTGAMIVFDETACTVRAMEVIARFYDHESCGQCSQCREGTQWLHQIFARIERGKGRWEDLGLLESLAKGMAPGKTICALSDAAAIPVLASLKHFRGEIEEHVRLRRCPLAPPGSARAQGASASGAHAARAGAH
jgi:NADH-quinone oxidoreductase subunit F